MTTKKLKIYIDPGHGEQDPGAVKYVREREVAVKTANYMKACLEGNYICRIKMSKGAQSTTERAAEANRWDADIFVSIHFNSGGGDGYEALVYDSDNKALGEHFEKYVEAAGQNGRGVKYRPDLAVLRLTDMPAILNEIAFVDHRIDIEDWNEDYELRKMGEALAEASATWLRAERKSLRTIAIVKSHSNLGQPKLLWEKVDRAVRYQIYRADYSKGTYRKMFVTTRTAYTNTSAKGGYTYYYRVEALDASGKVIAKSEPVAIRSTALRVKLKREMNIRTGPGTAYKKIGVYPKGSIITVLDTDLGKSWGYTAKGWIAITENYVQIEA